MDRKYYLAFSQFPGIGPHKFRSLLAHFGSAEEAFRADKKDLEKIIGSKTSQKFDSFRNNFNLKEYEDQLTDKGIEYLCLIDDDYPSLLKLIPNPPFLLYVKGNKKILDSKNTIAIVGTRKITSYGKDVTDLFSSELSKNFIIISGMALGVDGQAHKSCLESYGKTVAVLGNGVDLPFPSSNAKLYDEILKKGGAIISEFPPGQPPSVGSFPSRNRIIAGMSQGVLVTQGAEDSGSVITANLALEFNRPLFAVPGPITSSLSKGPNSLISKGAKLVSDPKDVLKDLGFSTLRRARLAGALAKRETKKIKINGLTDNELKILEVLENENLSFDQIAKRLKLNASQMASTLSVMEIKGIIKSSQGAYRLV